MQDCGRTLICGHICESKCSKSCPPCPKACETACGHSRCSQAGAYFGQQNKLRKIPADQKARQQWGRQCGDACPPCLEPCLNRCEHRQCSRKCSEPCDVEPCTEPCRKALKCSPTAPREEPHLCVGMCGEDCLDVCRICDPQRFADLQEIFFGSENEPNARFVQLKDCGHIFEAAGIDTWVANAVEAASAAQERQIITVVCPNACKTPIRRSSRYAHILSQRAADIEKVKKVVRGGDQETLNAEWNEVLACVKDVTSRFQTQIQAVMKILPAENYNAVQKFFASVGNAFIQQRGGFNSDWINTSRNVVRILDRLCGLLKTICETGAFKLYDEASDTHVALAILTRMPRMKAVLEAHVNGDADLAKYLLVDFMALMNVICNPQRLTPSRAFSDTTLQQLSNECQRLAFMADLVKWTVKAMDRGVDLSHEATSTLQNIFVALNSDKEFSGDLEESVKQCMQALMKLHEVSGFTLGEREIVEIRAALGRQVVSWFKCSKGHVYGIGDCGRAMVKSRCPECNEEIGGEFHALVATSREAVEMTGGRPETPPNPFVVQYGPEW